LIEMLVVIAIVAVLVALLFVGSRRVLESADLAECIARQKQLGAVLMVYANDHNAELPMPENIPAKRWVKLVQEYLDVRDDGNVYELDIIRDPSQDFADGRGVFGYNMALESAYTGGKPVRLAQLSKPSTFPLLVTSDGANFGGIRMDPNVARGPAPVARKRGWTGSTWTFGAAPNYGRKAVFLFADGHVAATDILDSAAWPWDDPAAFLVR
jgi:prepilin-type processing-associated H-X9-DG protein